MDAVGGARRLEMVNEKLEIAVLHDHREFVWTISTLSPVIPPSTPLEGETLGLHVVHPLSAVFSDEVGGRSST